MAAARAIGSGVCATPVGGAAGGPAAWVMVSPLGTGWTCRGGPPRLDAGARYGGRSVSADGVLQRRLLVGQLRPGLVHQQRLVVRRLLVVVQHRRLPVREVDVDVHVGVHVLVLLGVALIALRGLDLRVGRRGVVVGVAAGGVVAADGRAVLRGVVRHVARVVPGDGRVGDRRVADVGHVAAAEADRAVVLAVHVRDRVVIADHGVRGVVAGLDAGEGTGVQRAVVVELAAGGHVAGAADHLALVVVADRLRAAAGGADPVAVLGGAGRRAVAQCVRVVLVDGDVAVDVAAAQVDVLVLVDVRGVVGEDIGDAVVVAVGHVGHVVQVLHDLVHRGRRGVRAARGRVAARGRGAAAGVALQRGLGVRGQVERPAHVAGQLRHVHTGQVVVAPLGV